MNKSKRLFATLLAVVMGLSLATGCNDVKKIGEPKYKAVSGFYYSIDNGHTYGDGIKEYFVGNTVYMKVKFKVVSDKKKVSQVNVVLSIPNIESVEAKYLDGQVIKPVYDAKSNVTSYTFTASASKDPVEQECVIQFVPKAEGSVTMTLVFDDNVDPSYDSQSTLVFINEKPSETETSEAPTPTPTPEPTPTPIPESTASSETIASSETEQNSSSSTESSESTTETTSETTKKK